MNSRSGLIFVRSRPTFCGARLAADGDKNFIRFNLLLFTFRGNRYGHAGLRLLHLVDLGAGVEVDAALAEYAREFLGNFFVLHGNQARQHFDDRHLCVERAVDRRKLHAHRARTHNHNRLWKLFQAEDLNVSQDAVVGLQTGQHAGFRAGRENHVLRFELRGFPSLVTSIVCTPFCAAPVSLP